MTAARGASRSRPLDAWRGVLSVGLVGGAVALYLCLVGIVPIFSTRPLVRDMVSLGQLSLLLTFLAAGYMAARRAPEGIVRELLAGAVAGVISGLFLSGLILVDSAVTLRSFLPNASPDLRGADHGQRPGHRRLLDSHCGGLVVGLLGAALAVLPRPARELILIDLAVLILVGLFAGIVRQRMMSGDFGDYGDLARAAFASEGLTVGGTIVTLVVTTLACLAWTSLHMRARIRSLAPIQRRNAGIVLAVVLFIGVLILPWLGGTFVAMAVALVALYILMGMGLNITLGFAGLLDLGFVAFFAIGAYTVALLSSSGPFGIAGLSWWLAVPVAVIVAMAFVCSWACPSWASAATTWPSPRLASARSSRCSPAPTCSRPARRPAGHHHHPRSPSPRRPRRLRRAGADLLHLPRLRGRGGLRRLPLPGLATRPLLDGHPGGRGRGRGLGVNLVQSKTLAYMLGGGFAGWRRHLAGLVGAVFSIDHRACALHQRGRRRHRRRHGQHPGRRRGCASCSSGCPSSSESSPTIATSSTASS